MSDFWLSREEVRELDRRAIEGFGVPGIVLMENAGRGCAELLMRLNPERKPTVILCGPGNNGGDGFVIARHLHERGWAVNVWVFAEANPESRNAPDPVLTRDAYTYYEQLRSKHPVRLATPLWYWAQNPTLRNDLFDAMKVSTWIVDALFGTGLSRPLSQPFDEVLAQVNASRNPVLAVDIPSGLDRDTGEPLGPAVRATHTATFVAHKKGFLNPKSREWTGEVHVIDIGAPRVLVDEYRKRRNG